MIQVLEANKKPKFLQSLLGGLAAAAPGSIDAYLGVKEKEKEEERLDKENKALERLGHPDLSGIRTPKLRESLLEGSQKSKKNEAELDQESKTTQTIGKYFGPKAAELYSALTEGGKTKFTDSLIENSLVRKIPVDKFLFEYMQQNPQDFAGQQPQAQQPDQNIEPNKIGKTPKEIVAEEKSEKEFKREHETKRSDKVLEEAYSLGKLTESRQADIDLIKSSLNEVGGFDQDFVAEVFNFEPLRTAKGAQLKTAGKELFLKTIQAAGNRPNQWIEQQIGSAMTQIGKTPAANATIAEVAQFKLDLDKKWVDTVNQLEEKYEKDQGYIPGKIGREANSLMKDYSKSRQDELAYDLRRIYEKEQGVEKLSKEKKVPKGTPLTIEMARELMKLAKGDKEKAEKFAKKIGYDIPSEEIYMRQK